LECEFQNDYPVYLIQLYRDIGYITQAQYEAVDSKCANQGADLPDDCSKLLDEVQLVLNRSITSLTDLISMMLIDHAMKITRLTAER
jgi:hypothetical protein